MADGATTARRRALAPVHRAPAWPRWLFAALSPAGARARLSILIFHRVREVRDPLFPSAITAPDFRERMQWLRDWFNVLPLLDAVRALQRGTLPARAASITFDDGFADNAEVALPILRDLGLHATFFVAAGFLDGGRMWNTTLIEAVRAARGDELDLADLGLGRHAIASIPERRAAIAALLPALKHLPPDERQAKVDAVAQRVGGALPADLMMTSAQVRELAAAGMGIGGHTVSHPILAALDASSAMREIAEGRETLRAIVRQDVPLFAYPNGQPGGDYRAAHVGMVRDAGFEAAVSTAHGAARQGASLFELPRFTPWAGGPAKWAGLFARNLRTPIRCAPS